MIKNLFVIFLLVQSKIIFGQVNSDFARDYFRGASESFEYKTLKQERSLFNIASSNSYIEVACRTEWKCDPSGPWEAKGKFKPKIRVKMVTLAPSAATIYSDYMGSIRKYPLQGRIIWVTAFPELLNFCKNIKDKSKLKLSLERFLGLPHDTTKEKVITLWVKPEDIFRPCYDPDITKSTCPTDYPPGVPPAHKAWLDEMVIRSYPSPNEGSPYPFTRMGYTYFWGEPNTKMGASEYVVKPDAKVFVERVDTMEDYCR